jgi:cyclic pyranopterin phosphate synthase
LKRELSHYDQSGRARMVDVSAKTASVRQAEASAFVMMSTAVLDSLSRNPKGDPLETARLAGIMAAKKTAELIPLCHPLPLSHIDVELRQCENGIAISSNVKTTAETGVEIYDMCKALDKGIEIREIVLQHKSGGKSGDYNRKK